jgi:hypothetical protein
MPLGVPAGRHASGPWLALSAAAGLGMGPLKGDARNSRSSGRAELPARGCALAGWHSRRGGQYSPAGVSPTALGEEPVQEPQSSPTTPAPAVESCRSCLCCRALRATWQASGQALTRGRLNGHGNLCPVPCANNGHRVPLQGGSAGEATIFARSDARDARSPRTCYDAHLLVSIAGPGSPRPLAVTGGLLPWQFRPRYGRLPIYAMLALTWPVGAILGCRGRPS